MSKHLPRYYVKPLRQFFDVCDRAEACYSNGPHVTARCRDRVMADKICDALNVLS